MFLMEPISQFYELFPTQILSKSQMPLKSLFGQITNGLIKKNTSRVSINGLADRVVFYTEHSDRQQTVENFENILFLGLEDPNSHIQQK